MDEAIDIKDVRLDDDDDENDDDSLGGCSSADSDSDTAILGETRGDRQRRKRSQRIRIKPLTPQQMIGSAGATTSAAVQQQQQQAAQLAHGISTGSTATASVPPALAAAAAARRKNNIWATGLQEESLMENLKGCGVDREASSAYDRDVESYDYSMRFRMNAENALKRRKSSNSDSSNERPQSKYFRAFAQQQQNNKSKHRRNGGGDFDGAGSDGCGGGGQHKKNKKKSVHKRLGVRRTDDNSSSNDGQQQQQQQLDGPRTIADLEPVMVDTTSEAVARDLAAKLHEEKDELMLRIVDILGNALPLEVFAETQKIEANGGMMIMVSD